jgi:O-antigen ligase
MPMQILTAGRELFEESSLALPVAAFSALLAASLLYTPVPLLLLVGIPLTVYFATRPFELLLFMVFLIPFNFVFTVGPIPVAAELLKMFAWIPFLYSRSVRRQALKTSKYNWCFAALAGLLLLSVFRANDLAFTMKESVRLGSNIGLCYLVVNLVDSREKVFQIFRVLALSTFLVACYGFYQFAIQDYGPLFWIVNPRLDTSLSHGRDTFWEWRNRITSVLTSEMELGHYFNLCLPVGVVLWLTEGRKRLGSGWLLTVVAMFGGLLLTFTFAAWLSLAVTTGLFVLLLARKRRWKIILAGVLVLTVAACIVALSPVPAFLEGRILGTGIGSLAWDALTRGEIWLLALQAWRSHPLIGVGYGSFPNMTVGNLEWLTQDWVSSGTSPHNIYFYLLSELGLIGLAAMLFIFLRTVRTNLRQLGDPVPGYGLRYAALGLAFALTTALVGGCSDDSVLYGPHGSYLVWLFIGMSEAVSNLPATSSQALGLKVS